MKAFFLNIISGLKKFFLSRGFKKFISREFLILLLGGAIVGGASLYKEYDKNSIRKYNSELLGDKKSQAEILKAKIAFLSTDNRGVDSYAFGIYEYLEDLSSQAERTNKKRAQDVAYYGPNSSMLELNDSWVLNPTYKETYESFSEKFYFDKPIYFRGFGTKKYSLHVYNAIVHYNPKFPNRKSYSLFVDGINSSSNIAWTNIDPESGLTYNDIKMKIKILEIQLSKRKSSNLDDDFVSNAAAYALIFLYGLRLFLYLIISSIRVLRKG